MTVLATLTRESHYSEGVSIIEKTRNDASAMGLLCDMTESSKSKYLTGVAI